MSSTSRTFERAADYYDETRGFPPGAEQYAARLIVETGKLGPQSHVLEVGVGTGRVAIPVLPYVGRYTGVDLAMPMMDKVRKKPNGHQVQLIKGDITILPLPDKKFDAVIAVHIFHLIPNWQNALYEVGRILKADGVLLNCYDSNTHLNVFSPLWDAWNAAIPAQRRDTAGVNVQENPNYLSDTGFNAVSELGQYEYEIILKPSEFLHRLRSRVWSRLWGLSDEDFVKGLAAVEAILPQHFPDVETEIPSKQSFNVQAYRWAG